MYTIEQMKFIYSKKHNQEDAIIYYNAMGSWDINSQDGFDQNSWSAYLYFITSGKSCC